MDVFKLLYLFILVGILVYGILTFHVLEPFTSTKCPENERQCYSSVYKNRCGWCVNSKGEGKCINGNQEGPESKRNCQQAWYHQGKSVYGKQCGESPQYNNRCQRLNSEYQKGHVPHCQLNNKQGTCIAPNVSSGQCAMWCPQKYGDQYHNVYDITCNQKCFCYRKGIKPSDNQHTETAEKNRERKKRD